METIKISQFLKSKGFTNRTIKTYSSILNKVFKNLGEQFNEQQVEQWMTTLNLSPRAYNLYRAIINFYTKQYLSYSLKFTKAKVNKSLPTFVPKEEFNLILKQISNIKHKVGLCLMYGSGLRSYEVCRLKKYNLFFDKLIIKVEEAKGGKHRLTIMPPQIVRWVELLANSTNKDNPYLFQTYNRHICERSFQEVLKRAINKARIHKHITLHSFRHSFAINLVNRGIDIEEVRKLLGHSSLRTTQIYLQCKTIDLTQLAMSLGENITK